MAEAFLDLFFRMEEAFCIAGSLFSAGVCSFLDLLPVMEGDRHIGISFRLRFFLDTFLCVLGLLSRLVFFGSFWIFFALGGCRGLILRLARMVTFLCVLGLLSRLVFFGSFRIFFALGGYLGLTLRLVSDGGKREVRL